MYAKESKVTDIPIQNVNNILIQKFENFLKVEKEVAQNTMIRYMKCIKKVISMCLGSGWITIDPFIGKKFKQKKVIKDFLTMKELNLLKEKEFEIPRLEVVRDIFLFCCYTNSLYKLPS